MITLWGPSSSGKTAFLSLLYLRAQAERRDWNIFATSESSKMLAVQSQKIEVENEFPVGTREGTVDERQVSYRFQHKVSMDEFMLETTDRAGARSERMDEEIVASLKAAQGIVLFLDRSRPHRDTEVRWALENMYTSRSEESTQRDARPLAVCLSMVDRLIHRPEDFRRIKDKPQEFVREHLSGELLGWIEQYHSNVCFFPVSSVGIKLNYGTVEKAVFYDERLMLRVTSRGKPINIVEPFIWIFEQLRESK